MGVFDTIDPQRSPSGAFFSPGDGITLSGDANGPVDNNIVVSVTDDNAEKVEIGDLAGSTETRLIGRTGAPGSDGTIDTLDSAAATTLIESLLPNGVTLDTATAHLATIVDTVLGAATQLGPEAEFTRSRDVNWDVEVGFTLNFAWQSVASSDVMLAQVQGELNNSGTWIDITQVRGNDGEADNSNPTQSNTQASAIIRAADLPVGLQAAGVLRLRLMVSGAGTFRMSNDADEKGGMNLFGRYLKNVAP